MPELPEVAYVQPSYHLLEDVQLLLVPGAYAMLVGSMPEGFVAGETDLRRSGEDVLQGLRPLVEQDERDWTGAIGEKRARHVRLLTTRLKPAVRAMLVVLGEPPLDVWSLPWDDLVTRWRKHDAASSTALSEVLAQLHREPRNERLCGELLLRLLSSIRSQAEVVAADRSLPH
jgi:hypothetical protein